MLRDRKFWWMAFLMSVGIHIVFSLQAFDAAPKGGMAHSVPFLLLFKPHYILIFFLPPNYPIDLTGGIVTVDWFRFVGKLVVAYPASLLYGCILSAGWWFIRRKNA